MTRGQLRFAKEQVKKLQIANADFKGDIERVGRYQQLEKDKLSQMTERRDAIAKEHNESQHANEYAHLAARQNKEQLESLRVLRAEEKALHQAEVTRLKLEILGLEMPYEDCLSQQLRMQSKLEELQRTRRKQTAELKYLGRKYIAFLIMKSWARASSESHAEEVRGNEARIAE